MILHLGVIDEPYAGAEGTSTGDVAEFLEAKYEIMANFDRLHHEFMEEKVAESCANAIELLAAGVSTDLLKPMQLACGAIQAKFHDFLETGEIERMGISGVPTQAAKDGVRTSLKKKKEIKNIKTYRSRIRGTPRPSFVDTHAYQNSFIVTVD